MLDVAAEPTRRRGIGPAHRQPVRTRLWGVRDMVQLTADRDRRYRPSAILSHEFLFFA
jgi:hypothetical protein